MNKKEVDHIKDIIQTAKAIDDDISEYQLFDDDKAYEILEKRIEKTHTKQLFIKYLFRVAAVLLLPLITSTAVLSYILINQSSGEETTFYTVNSIPGLITQLELPDKSKVWLNGNSTLKYPSHFNGKKREVYLTGEGYFEVVSDKQNPFYVVVDKDTKVKAYGTKFNVNSYENEKAFEAVLEQGKIDVFAGNEKLTLNENELASFNKESGQTTVSKIYAYERTSWKDGRLVFRNTPLEDVIRRLSRQYNVDIILHKESLVDYKFRAAFSGETITEILDYLKLVAPLEWYMHEPKQQGDTTFERKKIDIWLKK